MRGNIIGKLIAQIWGLPSNESLQETERCLQVQSHTEPLLEVGTGMVDAG